MKVNLKKLIISVAIPLIIGGISGVITSGSRDAYANLNRPSIAPPGYFFPIIWTILFILMGISSYIILESSSNEKEKALKLYGFQLVVVFIWPIIFFTLQWYVVALLVLVVLWALVFSLVTSFSQISKLAGWLLLPYFIWVTYATYLNYQIIQLN